MVLLLSFEEVYQDSLTKRSKITEIGISQKVVEYLSDQKLDRFSGKPLPLRSTSLTFEMLIQKIKNHKLKRLSATGERCLHSNERFVALEDRKSESILSKRS